MTTTSTPPSLATQVYRVYIRATPEAIWTAITDPEWTDRYGYTGRASFDLRPGGEYRVTPNPEFKASAEAQGYPCPDVLVDGEVIETDPPRRLVTSWRMLMDPSMAAEPHSTVTWEIEDKGGFCAVTLTHELPESPLTATLVSGADEDQGAGGGHAWILSDLKSLLETGERMAPFS